MKAKYLISLIFTMALLLAGCGGKSDADLQKDVSAKLTADNVSGVTATVRDGVVTLTGEVADITVKNKAEATAKAVEGVKSVDNKLTTKPLPTPAPVADDKMLKGTIEESLKKKGISGVEVEVENGSVTLSGSVPKGKLAEVMMSASEAKPKSITNKVTEK